MKLYKHILYATDLMSESEDVAEKVRKMADLFGAKLSLVHVVENVPTAYGSPVVLDVEVTLHDEAMESLKKLSKKLEVKEEDAHILTGSTKPQVIELSEKLEIDLIVVGSHGRHGLALLLGSTANAVLDGSLCDVLAVKITEN